MQREVGCEHSYMRERSSRTLRPASSTTSHVHRVVATERRGRTSIRTSLSGRHCGSPASSRPRPRPRREGNHHVPPRIAPHLLPKRHRHRLLARNSRDRDGPDAPVPSMARPPGDGLRDRTARNSPRHRTGGHSADAGRLAGPPARRHRVDDGARKPHRPHADHAGQPPGRDDVRQRITLVPYVTALAAPGGPSHHA